MIFSENRDTIIYQGLPELDKKGCVVYWDEPYANPFQKCFTREEVFLNRVDRIYTYKCKECSYMLVGSIPDSVKQRLHAVLLMDHSRRHKGHSLYELD